MSLTRSAVGRLLVLLIVGCRICTPFNAAFGQFVNRQVGGVSIDAQGVISLIDVDQQDQLRQVREQALQAVPGDMKAHAGFRKVSLRQLDLAIREYQSEGKPLTDQMRYLAGLQRIQYVLVYPEQGDIVLAGPGEGWKVNPQGEVVGLTTGRPVMLLDDLLVALRSTEEARKLSISCSIDPSREGLAKLQIMVKKLRTIGDPATTAGAIEETLGPQNISVTGVPAPSHFAAVIVAADYKMKRLSMNFDPPLVKGMPSFMELIKAGPRGLQNMLPRWWLAPNYDALLASPDGLAWELRGAGVKTVAEEDFLTTTGQVQRTGKASAVAKKWADSMTTHYDELSTKDAVFGQLRNCMDLAIVAALIEKEQLREKAKCDLQTLLDEKALPTDKYNAPAHVDTKASLMKKGQNWVISASGGVQIDSWNLVQKSEPSDKLAPVREKAASENKQWWWN